VEGQLQEEAGKEAEQDHAREVWRGTRSITETCKPGE